MATEAQTRNSHRRAMARILELVATPGFELLPPIEQDYLIELVVCEAHGRVMPYPPPWKKNRLS